MERYQSPTQWLGTSDLVCSVFLRHSSRSQRPCEQFLFFFFVPKIHPLFSALTLRRIEVFVPGVDFV